MNLKRMTMTALLALGLVTIPAVAQGTGLNSSAKTTNHTAANSKMTHAMEKVDINTASKDQLAKLPGMSTTEAQKVINNRPYTMKNQLVSKNIVSKGEFAKIKSDIVAKRSETGRSESRAKTKKSTTTAGPPMK